MAETDNYQIWSPDYGDEWSLPIDLGAMAESVDTALVDNLWYFAGPDAAKPAAGVNGRRWYATDTGKDYIDNGAAWVSFDSGTVNISTFGTGWSATTGHTPRIRRMGKRVDIMGAVTNGSGAAWDHLLTIPVGYRPPAMLFIGHFFASGNQATGQLFVQPTGILSSPSSYHSGSLSPGSAVPLTGSWYID